MAKREKLQARCKTDIREAGLRATASRIAVLELLHSAKTAMSHAEVADALAGQHWDRVTLYRNLVDLADAGLARRLELGDHTWRFEVVDEDQVQDEHPHFVCKQCGTVECLPSIDIEWPARKVPRSVRNSNVEVSLRGLCNACG